jgi:hypothetical protein
LKIVILRHQPTNLKIFTADILAIDPHPKAQDSLPQNLTQALRQELEPILLEIQEAIAPQSNVPTPIASGNINWQRWFWGAVVVQWVTTLLFVGSGWRWHEQLQSAQQLLYTRSIWTIEKLNRIEKALGIQPKRSSRN